MTYDAFVLHAFTNYGISNELLNTVRPWVEKEIREWGVERPKKVMPNMPSFDLGFSELQDIVTIEQGMEKIKEYIWMSTEMETPKKTEKAKQKFYKDAGGRVGKGIYRVVLKTYYLTFCS